MANLFNAERAWINTYWLSCAVGALRLALVGLKSPVANFRSLRESFALGLGFYVAGMLLWITQILLGVDYVPGPSDLMFLAAPLPVFWQALKFAREQSAITANTIACDAVSLSLAITVVIVSQFAQYAGQWTLADVVLSMAYPILYLAPIGAFFVIFLSQPYKPNLAGAWLVTTGSVILGVAFTVWTYEAMIAEPPVGTITDFMFGVGTIMLGYGSAILYARAEPSFPRERRNAFVADVLPTLAVLVAVISVLTTEMPDPYKALSWIFLVALLLVNGFRQIRLVAAQKRSRERLSDLASRLESAQEEERKNLAQYLHDNIAQGIAVLRMKFDLANGDRQETASSDSSHQVNDIFDQLIGDIRTKTFELSPPSLDDNGLTAALGRLIESLNQNHAESFVLNYCCPNLPIRGAPARLLYRVGKELLTNVIKHAKASRVEVALDCRGKNIVMTVRDDGCGMDATLLDNEATESFGLYSIRESILSVKGDFQVRSKIGSGTIVEVSVPESVA
ncbi:MAG: sensor histidine kinase [Pseudomonadota bacterium]